MKHLPLVLMAAVALAGATAVGLAPLRGGAFPVGTLALAAHALLLLWWLQFWLQMGRGEAVWPLGAVRRREQPAAYWLLTAAWFGCGVVLGYVALVASYVAWFGNPNT